MKLMPAQINGHSSVLRCYLGMALAKLARLQEAQERLREAIEADPHNPLARFELANALIASEAFPEALQELEILKACPAILPTDPMLIYPSIESLEQPVQIRLLSC